MDVHATGDVEAVVIPPGHLRRLMLAEPELGDMIMRALILRRTVLIEAGAGGPVLIGSETAPGMLRLQSFLARNAYPCQVLDPATDRDAAESGGELCARPVGTAAGRLPQGHQS